MTDAALHLPASFLLEAFSDRSGVPLDFFELYYRGKRLEGEAALASYGIGKDSTIEVKMRGRGGMLPGAIGRGGSPDGRSLRRSTRNEAGGGGDGGSTADDGGFGSGSTEKVRAGSEAKDGVVPPAHDKDLSKLLTKLLRHKAVELGVAIDADGWVALSDVLVQINGDRLRELVGILEKLGTRVYTEADLRTARDVEYTEYTEYTENHVREVVRANDKRRFVISDDDTQIRAAQGHDMPGVGEKQGEPLTLKTAPEEAVHGSYVKHVHAILEQGLSRMGRHHVHLAKGLLGEKGVVSGMRPDAEVFIWVNVHAAIKGGLTFYESANGVILCGGQNGDGIIPPAYFSVVIELHGGFALEPAQASLTRSALYTMLSLHTASRIVE